MLTVSGKAREINTIMTDMLNPVGTVYYWNATPTNLMFPHGRRANFLYKDNHVETFVAPLDVSNTPNSTNGLPSGTFMGGYPTEFFQQVEH